MPFRILEFKIFKREVEGPIISRQAANKDGKVVSSKHRQTLLPERTPKTYFCQKLNRFQNHSAAGRIKSMNNLNDAIGNLRHSGL
jgi:hypothetical protein